MSTLFNIYGKPPTQREIDAMRRHTERNLRIIRAVKSPLTIFALIVAGVGGW